LVIFCYLPSLSMPYIFRPFHILLTLSIIFASPVLAWSSVAAASVVVKDFSGVASGLFNNMRTPAALIGGAIVPLGLLTAPALIEGEPKRIQLFKKANLLLAIASLLSEILAITYSTVAINKLAEVQFPLTVGVSELIAKNFEMAWIGTNVHFLLGMFGFGLLVGNKAYFLYGEKIGKIAGCWSVAAFLQCSSIVNRGISMGNGGDVGDVGSRFASNLFTLSLRYVGLVVSKARDRPLSMAAVGVALYSVFLTGQMVKDALKEKVE